MKERPILFSGPMVRALLEGRKTQTRRVVKPMPDAKYAEGWYPDLYNGGPQWNFWGGTDANRNLCGDGIGRRGLCPYGVPGDRLWVRESARIVGRGKDNPDKHFIDYRAGGLVDCDDIRHIEPNACAGMFYAPGEALAPPCPNDRGNWVWPWKTRSSIPRWASRITLEVVSVRVERVEAITEADAIAEGAERNVLDGHAGEWEPDWGYRTRCAHYPAGCECFPHATARDWFMDLFYGINKRAPRGANPWVWVIEFKQIGGAA